MVLLKEASRCKINFIITFSIQMIVIKFKSYKDEILKIFFQAFNILVSQTKMTRIFQNLTITLNFNMRSNLTF